MSTIELTGVETEPLVLRTIYFEGSAEHGGEEPRRLEDVEYALRQLRHLLVYAGRMSRSVRDEDVAGEEDFFTVNYDQRVVYRASERGVAYRLVRVEMGSPLTVLRARAQFSRSSSRCSSDHSRTRRRARAGTPPAMT